MNGRLKKRGILALIIYFLMITAVSTPIAFMTGKARGADREGLGAGPSDGLSQNGTDEGDGTGAIETPISLAMALRDGAPESNMPARPDRPNPNAAFGPRTPSLKKAALGDAVMRAIAGGPSGVSSGGATNEGQTPAPFSLAMAPGLSPGGGVMQGGAVNKPGGYPGAIIPGILFAPDGDTPQPPETPTTNDPGSTPPMIDDPNTIVTPLPAALPLMLTGVGGLFAFGRRKSR